MPCEVLGASAATRKQIRGEMYRFQDMPCQWGDQEVPPAFFVSSISDATAEEMGDYTEILHHHDGVPLGPRYVVRNSEVNQAHGRTYTRAEFEAVLDEYVVTRGKRKKWRRG